MKIVECVQHSTAWDDARRGIPTSSGFEKIITPTGKSSASAIKYARTLAAERISGFGELSYHSKAMEEGSRREEESRLVYAMLKEVEVRQVGFCLSDCGRYGCSPDGLVGEDGLIELKNRTGGVAIEHLLENKLPPSAIPQVQGQLFVTGRQWCDYVSYYTGLPTLIIRVERDEKFLAILEGLLESFCCKLDEICTTIRLRELN
ncbi:MAG: YqaJ viral recombinase family protein [Candidatus Bathyarchaeota archaeon]|nr:YqaJ viral recombinase family protein [Candidatus Bathyarchaeota archaeon]